LEKRNIKETCAKGAFEKGYKAKWSEETFQICSRLAKPSHVCELQDLANVIDSFFYEQELTRIEKNLGEEQFIVYRVIKSRGRRIITNTC